MSSTLRIPFAGTTEQQAPVPRQFAAKPVILVFIGSYLPGYRAGGPVRTISSMVRELGNEFDFRIVTSDRDLGDRNAYPGILVNKWHDRYGSRLLYLSPGLGRWWRIARVLLSADSDMVYLNSFLARSFSILPMWLRGVGLARRIPVLMAPRGEFSPGALGMNTLRKQYYIRLVRFLGLYRSVVWHASTEHEKKDISCAFPNLSRLIIAANPATPDISLDLGPEPRKACGSLNVVFLSRISRMKNLDAALRVLARVRGNVTFNVYGPIEDAEYWAECRQLIKNLPPNVTVDYRGELPHSRVGEVLRNHHLFFLPTQGENFGHAIVEALACGCPVLISDQTPWRQLREKGVGWDLPLDQIAAFQEAIHSCVAMDEDTWLKFSRKTKVFGVQASDEPRRIEENRALFRSVLGGNPTGTHSGRWGTERSS